MPALTDLRDQACLVGIGETDYTRGTSKSALELALEASLGAIEDAGLQPGDIDAVILPNGAGSGGTAGDFCANLGLQDLHYTTSLQEMGGGPCVCLPLSPPQPMCTSCHSLEWEWAPTKGTGTVYCWTTVYQALDPAFAEDVPYAAVVVELDEGPRLTTGVTGVAPDELHVGMPVEVWFDTVSDDVTLPKFRPQLPL